MDYSIWCYALAQTEGKGEQSLLRGERFPYYSSLLVATYLQDSARNSRDVDIQIVGNSYMSLLNFWFSYSLNDEPNFIFSSVSSVSTYLPALNQEFIDASYKRPTSHTTSTRTT